MMVAGALSVLPTAIALGRGVSVRARPCTSAAVPKQAGGRHVLRPQRRAGYRRILVAGFLLVPLLGTPPHPVLLVAHVEWAAAAGPTAGTHDGDGRSSLSRCRDRGIRGVGPAVPDPYSSALAYRYPGERLLWSGEGAQTTVSIHETADGTRAMYLDGLHQANAPRHGQLPPPDRHAAASIHPDPRRAWSSAWEAA